MPYNAESDAEQARWEYEHRNDPPATMADAHAEWHRNSGVPVGLSCPWDACDPGSLDPATLRGLLRQRDVNMAIMRGEEGEATIRCAHCGGVHLAPRYVRECAAPATVPAPENDDVDPDTDRYSQSDLDAMADLAADRYERDMDR